MPISDILSEETVFRDETLLGNIQSVILEEENALLLVTPSMDEVRDVVLGMRSDGATGLDGFTGLFFQRCWEVIGEDILESVVAFF